MKPRHVVACASLALATCLASTRAAAQVVVVGTKSPTVAMNKNQVADAFMGKVVGLEPVDLAEGNAVREEFYARSIGRSPAQMKSYWAKLMFTGKATPPREYPSAAEVKKALSANPKAIGYIEKSDVDGGVKIIFEGH